MNQVKYIKVGDLVVANGEKFEVTGIPYIPEDPSEDCAIDEEYIKGEYVIEVNSGGVVYEHEVDEIIIR